MMIPVKDGADLVKQMNYKDDKTSSKEMGYPSWYWNAIKKRSVRIFGSELDSWNTRMGKCMALI